MGLIGRSCTPSTSAAPSPSPVMNDDAGDSEENVETNIANKTEDPDAANSEPHSSNSSKRRKMSETVTSPLSPIPLPAPSPAMTLPLGSGKGKEIMVQAKY